MASMKRSGGVSKPVVRRSQRTRRQFNPAEAFDATKYMQKASTGAAPPAESSLAPKARASAPSGLAALIGAVYSTLASMRLKLSWHQRKKASSKRKTAAAAAGRKKQQASSKRK